MRITVYTKPGCHLCEDTLAILDRLTPQYGLEVDEVNILDDMALYEQFKHDIPVLDIEEGRLGRLKAPIDEPSLRTAFEVARRAPISGGPGKGGGTGTGSGSRSVLPRRRETLIDRVVRFIGMHWLALACGAMGIFVILPWLAPVFAALGWWAVADPIYTAYAFTCHQLPERAGTVLGYQVAFCYRNTALYGGTFLFGLLYGLTRAREVSWLRWLRVPLPVWGLILLVLPMGIDGVTHMLGLRDMADTAMDSSFGSFLIGSQPFSLNWWLRIITGLLAALGMVWFAAPRMDAAIEESESLRIIISQSASKVEASNPAL